MTSETTVRLVEFLFWVATVAGVVVLACVGVGVAVGAGLVGAKYALFVVGFVLFGVGSLAIQPASPHRETERFTLDRGGETMVEAAIQRLPPLDDARLPRERRVSRDVKLFAVSLVVLGVSVLLEVGFGVSR